MVEIVKRKTHLHKVIVAGHICLDITPKFPDKKLDNLWEILSPGKLIQMGEANVHTGGAVANTGLAMKVLGADVTLIGKIGRDAFGDMIITILKRYDLESGILVSETESTSYSVVLAVPGIDRIFLHNPGANHRFLAEDIPQSELEEASLLHFGYPPLMKSMYESNGDELVALMKRIKAAEIATSLDMAAIDANSQAGQADWETILKRVIPYVDFFEPSAEELCVMLDPVRFAQWQERAGGRDITEVLYIERDVKPLADRCMEYGAKVLLIKCGALGLYYRTAQKGVLKNVGNKIQLDLNDWADREGFEKSYQPKRVVSGTGAGDTSIAAFLTAMLNSYSLEECMHLSAAAGASCVEEYDALSGLKSLEELEMKIKSGWEKRT
jgi:sugar/nucleoside kinase (ribokinase family)